MQQTWPGSVRYRRSYFSGSSPSRGNGALHANNSRCNSFGFLDSSSRRARSTAAAAFEDEAIYRWVDRRRFARPFLAWAAAAAATGTAIHNSTPAVYTRRTPASSRSSSHELPARCRCRALEDEASFISLPPMSRHIWHLPGAIGVARPASRRLPVR
jgi:hypothetical protein